jgi:signal transduction histidine kinase
MNSKEIFGEQMTTFEIGNEVRTIRKQYLIMIILILSLTAVAQFAIQYFLNQNSDHSNVINVAGRQRMLSQRIALYSNKHFLKKDPESAAILKKDLSLFLESHQDLKYGNKSLNIAPAFTEEIAKGYQELVPLIKDIEKSVNCLIESGCNNTQEGLDLITSSSSLFLPKMNTIVKQSENFAKGKINFLSYLEIALFIFILAIMAFELFFVLLPFNTMMMKRLQEMNQKELESEKIKQLAEIGTIGSEVIHEINNFMTVIDGSAQILALDAKKNPNLEKSEKYITKIRKNIKRIVGISQNMSRMSSKDTIEVFRIDEIFSELTEFFEDKMKKRQIEFDLVSQGEYHVESNRNRIIQVLFNIVKNAIHAVEKSEVKKITLQTEIKHKDGSDLVVFKVFDTGSGIAPEHKDKLTEAFFTTKEAGKGTGLGLSLAKRTAHELGGELLIVTQLADYSTCFEFSAKNRLKTQPKIGQAS